MESAPNPLGWLSPNQHSVFVFKENNDRHHCVELFEPNLVYEKSFLQVLSIGDLGKVCLCHSLDSLLVACGLDGVVLDLLEPVHLALRYSSGVSSA